MTWCYIQWRAQRSGNSRYTADVDCPRESGRAGHRCPIPGWAKLTPCGLGHTGARDQYRIDVNRAFEDSIGPRSLYAPGDMLGSIRRCAWPLVGHRNGLVLHTPAVSEIAALPLFRRRNYLVLHTTVVSK
jgi:hypothetical protein